MYRLPRLSARLQTVERALAASQTENRGTYQNPPALNPNTFMLIHFQDYVDKEGNVKWLFRKEACGR